MLVQPFFLTERKPSFLSGQEESRKHLFSVFILASFYIYFDFENAGFIFSLCRSLSDQKRDNAFGEQGLFVKFTGTLNFVVQLSREEDQLVAITKHIICHQQHSVYEKCML